MTSSSRSAEMEIRLAAQQFMRELERLTSAHDSAMKTVGTGANSAARSVEQLEAKHGEAAQSIGGDASTIAKSLEQSFRVLGVKSIQALETELQQLQGALANVRNSPNVLPADKARAVAAFNERLGQLREEAGRTGPALGNIEKPANQAANALSSAAHKAAAWTAALVGISSLTDVGQQIIETGSQFENLRVRLDNLLGSTEKADAAFTMIKDLAASTPFEVSGLTESFIKLTAMGMEPTEAQMRSLADVAANLGGGTEVLTGVTTALGQAWAKGKLQGEEIMQLAERGVPVWDALARATGRSVPELQRMSEAGAMGREVIGQLIDELGRMNAGASDQLMKTYAGAVANAKDALAEFFDMISQSGVLDWLTDKMRELLAEFDRMKESGELEAKAKAIADAFLDVATVVEEVIGVLVDLSPVLLKVAEAALALKVANMAGTLLSVASSARGATAAVTAMGASSAAAVVPMEAAAVAGGRLASVMRGLRALTGIGLVMGVAELGMEFLRAKRAAEEGDEAVRRMLATPPINGPRDAAKAASVAMDETTRKVSDATKEFDTLISKGSSAAEALGKVGKDFDLSSGGGIKAATLVLNELVATAKITADQFTGAWSAALKNVDLGEFGIRARLAMENAADGGKALTAALDAGLREAIRRSGADFDVLSGGMSKASASAINDVEAVIGGLDRLKAMGVDTGLALSTSLTKAISTADSEKALEAVRARIEAVRGELGSTVADGLLDQARKKSEDLAAALDKALPGINGVAEAMRKLGVTSDAALKKTAEEAKQAYDIVRATGTSSAREVGEAFKKAADAAIAANGGLAPSWVQAEAAIRGYTVVVDEAGKATLQLAASLDKTRDSHRGAASAANEHRTAQEALNATKERELDALEKAIELKEREAELERKRLGVDKDGFSVNSNGDRVVVESETRESLYEKAKNAGLTAQQADRISKQFIDERGQAAGYASYAQQAGESWSVIVQREIQKLARSNEMGGAAGGVYDGATGSSGSGPTQTVNHVVTYKGPSKTERLNMADADSAGRLKGVLQELADAAGRSS